MSCHFLICQHIHHHNLWSRIKTVMQEYIHYIRIQYSFIHILCFKHFKKKRHWHNTLLLYKNSNESDKYSFWEFYTANCTCKEQHVLKVKWYLRFSSQIQKKWQWINVDCTSQHSTELVIVKETFSKEYYKLLLSVLSATNYIFFTQNSSVHKHFHHSSH